MPSTRQPIDSSRSKRNRTLRPTIMPEAEIAEQMCAGLDNQKGDGWSELRTGL